MHSSPAGDQVCWRRGGVVCSLRRGLISGSLLLVNVACREGGPPPGKFFIFLEGIVRMAHESLALRDDGILLRRHLVRGSVLR